MAGLSCGAAQSDKGEMVLKLCISYYLTANSIQKFMRLSATTDCSLICLKKTIIFPP